MPGKGGGNDFKSVVCDEDEQDKTIEWRPNIPTCISKILLIFTSLATLWDWGQAVTLLKIVS